MSGLEPPTPTLSGWCSNLLSYIPLFSCGHQSFWVPVGVVPPYVLRCATNASPRVVHKGAELHSIICIWKCFVIITKLNSYVNKKLKNYINHLFIMFTKCSSVGFWLLFEIRQCILRVGRDSFGKRINTSLFSIFFL